MNFKGLLIRKNKEGVISAGIEELKMVPNEEMNALVKVNCSTINYKDSLAITGKPGIIRDYPAVPGIDFSGTIVKGNLKNFNVGDNVLLNGFGVGEKYWGGLAQYISVKEDWLIEKPKNLSHFSAMAIGTAGYTSMLCVEQIQKYVSKEKGSILVTGATGGVGSIAIILLSKLGYNVIASTGKENKYDFLKQIGAKEIIPRKDLEGSPKLLEKQKWIGVVDTVGGNTLSSACASACYNGVVTACGMVGSMKFNSSVAPFILRNVKLIGIDSVYRSINDRKKAWRNLSQLLNDKILNNISDVIALDDVVDSANRVFNGQICGRLVVDLSI